MALSSFFLSFCAVSSTTANFSAISLSAFSTLLKSVSIQLAFSSSRIFALNLSLKSVYTAGIDVQRLPEVGKHAFQTSARRRRHPPSTDLKVPNTYWLENCTGIAEVRVNSLKFNTREKEICQYFFQVITNGKESEIEKRLSLTAEVVCSGALTKQARSF